jgi:hypothetical protein
MRRTEKPGTPNARRISGGKSPSRRSRNPSTTFLPSHQPQQDRDGRRRIGCGFDREKASVWNSGPNFEG